MVVSSGLSTQEWLVTTSGRCHRLVVEVYQLGATSAAVLRIASHVISAGAPGLAILRLPLLVAPLPKVRSSGDPDNGAESVLTTGRPAGRLPARTAGRSTTTQIYEGTNQIQREVMARHLLKG
jgi:hypothetical protein